MMYGELYKYFIHHKRLNMPGIGTFQLERKPAVTDFPNRIINGPSFSIAMLPEQEAEGRNFFQWLANALGISDREAVIRFNDFVYQMKQRLRNGDRINWDGIGVLSTGLGGEIRFEPPNEVGVINPPVKAVKVIRDKAEHTVRVGEDERTSAQMIELLNQPNSKKSNWWAWALAVAILAIMFIGWYFSAYGLKTSSTGNTQQVHPTEAAPTYKVPQ